MKILKSGKEAYVAECNKCCCVFSFGKEEVEYSFWRNETYSFLHCPECENKVDLPENNKLWMTRKEWEDEQNS